MGADDWYSFWDGLGSEIGETNLRELRNTDERWEGSEDGQPMSFHIESLRECGFEQGQIIWQCLGKAAVSEHKPR